ncbi:MAG: hypothetical protein IPO92_09520 [Saprospiraceae bacterium]|nr:hypothetical protein [Saprospiraceae bacterium]
MKERNRCYSLYYFKTFTFDFKFPYFDLMLDSIYTESGAVVDIGPTEEYAMYLFSTSTTFELDRNFVLICL